MRKLTAMSVFMSVFCFATLAQAAEPGRCLRWVDIEQFNKVAPDKVIAQTRNRGSYLIVFSSDCDYQKFIGWYFVVEPYSRLDCITKQTVFHVNNAGSCGVSEIVPAPQDSEAHRK